MIFEISIECETEPDTHWINFEYDGDEYVILTAINTNDDGTTNNTAFHISINKFKKMIEGMALLIEGSKEYNK